MRAILRTYPSKLEAQLVADQLLDAGIPVTVTSPLTPHIPNRLGTLWIEDDSLLRDDNVRELIEGVMADVPMRQDEEDAIAAMATPEPVQDREGTMWVRFALAVAVLLIGLGFYLRFQWIAEREALWRVRHTSSP